MMKRILLVFLVLISTFSYAEEFKRTWLGLFNKKEVSENFFLWAEVQARIDNEYFDEQQQLIRLGLLRPLSEKHEVGLLYAHIKTGMLQENRLALQLVTNWHDSGLTLRQRLEFRQLEGNDDRSIRYRALLRYQKNKFLVWNEAFINLTRETWTRHRTFERNRVFVGWDVPLAKTRLEVGYLHQYIPKDEKSTHEHVLIAYLFY